MNIGLCTTDTRVHVREGANARMYDAQIDVRKDACMHARTYARMHS